MSFSSFTYTLSSYLLSWTEKLLSFPLTLHKKRNFTLRISSVNLTKSTGSCGLPNLQVPADLVNFTVEVLDGKLHFLCIVSSFDTHNNEFLINLELLDQFLPLVLLPTYRNSVLQHFRSVYKIIRVHLMSYSSVCKT